MVEGVWYVIAAAECTGPDCDTACRAMSSACEYSIPLEPVIGCNFNDFNAGDDSVGWSDYNFASSDTSPDSICVDGLLPGVMLGEITLK